MATIDMDCNLESLENANVAFPKNVWIALSFCTIHVSNSYILSGNRVICETTVHISRSSHKSSNQFGEILVNTRREETARNFLSTTKVQWDVLFNPPSKL